MAKTTFLQRILNRPSQTYYEPYNNKDYHSAKAVFQRAAASCPERVPAAAAAADSIFLQPSALSTDEIIGDDVSHSISAPPSPAESDNSALDVFYTPPSSPPTSMLLDSRLISAILPLDKLKHHKQRNSISTRTPSSSSSVSVPSSSSSTSSSTDDARSLFSQGKASDSTYTEPSEHASSKPTSPSPLSTPPSSSSSSTSPTFSRPAPPEAPAPHSTPILNASTYTDADWAKDVRWLVPPDVIASNAKSRRFSAQPAIPEHVELSSSLRPADRPNRRAKTLRAPRVRKDRMSALWEEEEPGEPVVSSQLHPPSRANSVASDATARSPLGRSGSRGKRRSAPVDEGAMHAPARASISSRESYDSAPASVSMTTTTNAVAGAIGSGYTSLTLPRASYKPADPFKTLAGGKFDLAKDGRGQVTMVSVEVVRGVAGAGGGLRGLLSRRASTARRSVSEVRPAKAPSAGASKKLDLTAELALTSHRAPPSYVPGSHVLVQVYAVALEDLDGRLAKEEGPGFVPGRAIIGRVVEAGVEVPSEESKRGEWVAGLADVKKSGGLAEFILLERHRVHRVPQPTTSSQSLFPPSPSRSNSPALYGGGSQPRSRRSSASSSRSLTLPRGPSLAELALLPLAVPVYRAIRTWQPPPPTALPTPPPIFGYDEFPLAVSRKLLAATQAATGSPPSLSTSSTPNTPYISSPLAHSVSSLQSTTPHTPIGDPRDDEPPCALVLRGQTGTGALGVLLLRAMHPHVRVLAHVEPEALGLPAGAVHVFPLQGWGAHEDEPELDARGADALARLRQWGVDAACVGSPVAAMGAVECPVDFVLDTVGGSEIWAAAAKLMSRDRDRGRGEAAFATTVGETGRAVPGAQDHWRAARGPSGKVKGMGRRKVRWSWVVSSTDVDFEGLDVRENLRSIAQVLGVGDGGGAGGVGGVGGSGKGVWSALGEVAGELEAFERAPSAFGRLGEGGCAVVKVAGS